MPGEEINVHGGVSYTLYLDGDKEFLLTTEVIPQKGPWVQLTDLLWSHIPEDHSQHYYPDAIGVQAWINDSEYDLRLPVWPFSQQLALTPKQGRQRLF